VTPRRFAAVAVWAVALILWADIIRPGSLFPQPTQPHNVPNHTR
jgi:hypothetical protein